MRRDFVDDSLIRPAPRTLGKALVGAAASLNPSRCLGGLQRCGIRRMHLLGLGPSLVTELDRHVMANICRSVLHFCCQSVDHGSTLKAPETLPRC